MAEFEFINHVKQLFSTLQNDNIEGIGDDCAILEMGDSSLLFTTDMLQENIHFLRNSISPYDLGYKSLAVNLSDVAAMGATPIASMLSISLPKELNADWAEEFIRGYHALSSEFNVPLIGGDTTSSKGDVTINVVAIGRASSCTIKRRSGAKVGDIIMVNGSLGESGDGLRSILKGDLQTPNAKRHMRPCPQIREGEWLGEQQGVGAMMDISDGVASDIRHILSQSGVGADIELTSIPTSVDITTALTAGEDYKLLFTVRPDKADSLINDYQEHFGKPLHKIGTITSSSLRWLHSGSPTENDYMGYRHE